MTDLSTLPLFVTLPGFFVAGLLIGHVYFRALRRTADMIVRHGRPLVAIGLTLGRLAVLAAAFYLAALTGGLALLAALGGVLCSKALVLARVRKEET